jgi:hypothetical protein
MVTLVRVAHEIGDIDRAVEQEQPRKKEMPAPRENRFYEPDGRRFEGAHLGARS